MAMCKFCLGKGRILCTTCHGTRKDPRNPNTTCRTCDGKGHIVCNSCGGDGKSYF